MIWVSLLSGFHSLADRRFLDRSTSIFQEDAVAFPQASQLLSREYGLSCSDERICKGPTS